MTSGSHFARSGSWLWARLRAWSGPYVLAIHPSESAIPRPRTLGPPSRFRRPIEREATWHAQARFGYSLVRASVVCVHAS